MSSSRYPVRPPTVENTINPAAIRAIAPRVPRLLGCHGPARGASPGLLRRSSPPPARVRARLERRVAAHKLQVLQKHENESKESEELHCARRGSGAEAAQAEEPRVEQGLLASQFPPQKGDEQHNSDGERRQGHAVPSSPGRAPR